LPAFKLVTDIKPKGDRPKAIRALAAGVGRGDRFQTLLEVTGSGKTFTMANVVSRVQKATLVIAHNKTLAAQLYGDFRDLFPDNAVEFFVSYYDYYQPEAYLPASDTDIEKEYLVRARQGRVTGGQGFSFRRQAFPEAEALASFSTSTTPRPTPSPLRSCCRSMSTAEGRSASCSPSAGMHGWRCGLPSAEPSSNWCG
jgi:hypothetical protein